MEGEHLLIIPEPLVLLGGEEGSSTNSTTSPPRALPAPGHIRLHPPRACPLEQCIDDESGDPYFDPGKRLVSLAFEPLGAYRCDNENTMIPIHIKNRGAFRDTSLSQEERSSGPV